MSSKPTVGDPREGGAQRFFNRSGRGKPVSLADLAKCGPIAPTPRRFYEAWSKMLLGSKRWSVVEVSAEGGFIRTMREVDYTITRQQVPMTEESARSHAQSLNESEDERLARGVGA